MKILAPELLAPAGSPESLEFAIRYGADAVYLGTDEFSMRTVSRSFTEENLKENIDFAHDKGVNVYLASNIIAHNSDLGRVDSFFEMASKAEVDALIISDLGMLNRAKKIAPDLEIHISTQLGVTNYETAHVLYELGAKRVVLARELSIDEIAEIKAKVSPEMQIECFVHGAMCVSFSGRCLISNYLTGRDANRGNCSQPCRWNYSLVEEKRPGEYLPVLENENGTFILNSKDLSMIEHLEELRKAGIDSFKIEGRAKNAYYTGVTTNAYRIATDAMINGKNLEAWVVEELNKVSHRPYDTGFFFDKPIDRAQVSYMGGYLRQWDLAGIVESSDGTRVNLVQRNRFFDGDTLEILEAGKKPYEVLAEELMDGEGNKIQSAPHPMMKVSFKSNRKPVPGSIVRISRKA